MDTLKNFKDYKLQRKAEKIKSETLKKLEKNRLSLLDKSQESIKKYINDINIQYQKKTTKYMNKLTKQSQRKINNLIRLDKWKEIKVYKEKDNWKLWRKKSIAEIQLHSRLSNMDKNWNIFTMDLKWRHYTACSGGHYRSKHNNPQLVFEIDNIRPITGRTNKIQWDQPWYMRKDKFIEKIWQNRYDELDAISNDKELKEEHKKLNHNVEYLKEQYHKWKKANDILLEIYKKTWKTIKKEYNPII